ncbi:MAG: HupE/UreJ family protein [Thermoanaerobaculia bacterium]
MLLEPREIFLVLIPPLQVGAAGEGNEEESRGNRRGQRRQGRSTASGHGEGGSYLGETASFETGDLALETEGECAPEVSLDTNPSRRAKRDRKRLSVAATGFLLLYATAAPAHEIRPAYLELTETASGRVRVVWKRPVTGEVALDLRPRFPQTWKPVGTERVTRTPDAVVLQGVYDSGGPLAGQKISIDGLSSSPTDALVRVHRKDGTLRTAILKPASPSYEIPADASPSIAAYLTLGIDHILRGVDHLLFVLGLLVIVGRRWGMMFKTISAFTLAHSLTLGAATLGFVRVPSGPLNVVIALSILFLGVEVLRMERGETSLTIGHPWVAAFGFGLVHGLGFASGLSTLGLGPKEIVPALFLFNVGVEIGQLAFVGLSLTVRRSLRVLDVPSPRWAEAIPGYVVGCLGAYWTIAQMAKLVRPGV